MEQILVSNLKKSYQNQKMTYEVLKGINFSVQEGEFVSICGPSRFSIKNLTRIPKTQNQR